MNLGLRITAVRTDGYHEIDSVFVPLDLADRVRVTAEPGAKRAITLRASGPFAAEVPSGPDNLVVRAAEALLDAAGVEARVELELEKHIPTGAGLGGGSSDAGAVLRALSAQLGSAVVGVDLPALALRLGADVPFFLDPRPARVRGIGEWIEPMEGVPALALLLAHPGISLATARVYADWDDEEGALTPESPRPTMRPAFGPGSEASALRDLLENDLEPPAVRLCPAIAQLEEQILSLGALGVGMSGSGATVFGVFGSRQEAEEALASSPFGRDGAERGVWAWARVAETEASDGAPHKR